MPEPIHRDSESVQDNEDKKLCGCCFSKKVKKGKVLANNIIENGHSEANSVYELPKLTKGLVIHLNGFVKRNCSRFAINLSTTGDDNGDIGLHINPRLALHYTVRNSRISNTWGKEDTTCIRAFPFAEERKFSLDILIDEHTFYIAIDGHHFYEYESKVSHDKLKYCVVNGPVRIDGIEFKQQESYPDSTPFLQIEDRDEHWKDILDKSINEVTEKTSELCTTPIYYDLSNHLGLNTRLEIYGRVKLLPHKFYINFQNTENIWPHPIIPMHLNFVFLAGQGTNYLIKNTWNHKWGDEERIAIKQLQPGCDFCIGIQKMGEHFQITVNDIMVSEFKIRLSTDLVKYLLIWGDVFVYRVVSNSKNVKLLR